MKAKKIGDDVELHEFLKRGGRDYPDRDRLGLLNLAIEKQTKSLEYLLCLRERIRAELRKWE